MSNSIVSKIIWLIINKVDYIKGDFVTIRSRCSLGLDVVKTAEDIIKIILALIGFIQYKLWKDRIDTRIFVNLMATRVTKDQFGS